VTYSHECCLARFFFFACYTDIRISHLQDTHKPFFWVWVCMRGVMDESSDREARLKPAEAERCDAMTPTG